MAAEISDAFSGTVVWLLPGRCDPPFGGGGGPLGPALCGVPPECVANNFAANRISGNPEVRLNALRASNSFEVMRVECHRNKGP